MIYTSPPDDVISLDSDHSTPSVNSTSKSDASSPEEFSSDDGSSSEVTTMKIKDERGNRKATQLNNCLSSEDSTTPSKVVPKKRKVKVVMKRARETGISAAIQAQMKLEYPGIRFTDVFGDPYSREKLKQYMKKMSTEGKSRAQETAI